MIDGNIVKNYDIYPLTVGEHTVEDMATRQIYSLEVLQSSQVASIFLNTESGSLDYLKETKENYESGTTLIITEDGNVEYEGILEKIHGRGNSSWYDGTKLPFTIKLPVKMDLFHMGAAKRWVLLANESDRTLLRNYVVQDMASTSGVQYSPESVFVDFYANGEYQGMYQLSEKVEIDKERVAIADLEKKTREVNPSKALDIFPIIGSTEGVKDTTPSTIRGYEIENNPEDITGGYLFAMNMGYSYLEGKSGFVSARNQAVDIEGPTYASEEEVSYIANLYQEMEDAIYDWDGINQTTQKHYYEYMDLNSFAKKYLVEEISMNLDASMGSQYMYKYPDNISTKIYAGPAWDYDKSLGNGGDGYNEFDLSSSEGLYAAQDVTESTIWYAVFFRPEFHVAVLENYYGNFREHALEAADTKITVWAEQLQDSMIMNAIRWNQYGTAEKETILQGYQQEIATLREFITQRIDYLDSQWQEEAQEN